MQLLLLVSHACKGCSTPPAAAGQQLGLACAVQNDGHAFKHLHAALCSQKRTVALSHALPSIVLESLDLRDNQLKSVPALAAFTALRYLELSYNEVGRRKRELSLGLGF